jgi:hypothetical protein
MDGRGTWVTFPSGAMSSPLRIVQTRPEANLGSYSMGPGIPFLGGKAAGGKENHSLPRSVNIKNELSYFSPPP